MRSGRRRWKHIVYSDEEKGRYPKGRKRTKRGEGQVHIDYYHSRRYTHIQHIPHAYTRFAP